MFLVSVSPGTFVARVKCPKIYLKKDKMLQCHDTNMVCASLQNETCFPLMCWYIVKAFPAVIVKTFIHTKRKDCTVKLHSSTGATDTFKHVNSISVKKTPVCLINKDCMMTEQIKMTATVTFDLRSVSALLQGRQKRLQLAEQISEGDCSHSSQQLDHFSGS